MKACYMGGVGRGGVGWVWVVVVLGAWGVGNGINIVLTTPPRGSDSIGWTIDAGNILASL